MTLINVILLNVLWFTCVLGAANDLLWPGFVVLLVLIGINIYKKSLNKIDVKIVLFSIIFGLVIDGILHARGMVNYELKILDAAFLPPIWIMILWVGFGATVRTGMQWLLNHPKIGAMFMLIGAPLSYVSAAKLGAAQIPVLWHAMSFIGISWLVYFVFIVWFTQQDKDSSDAIV
ncbi:DUF2878 domain-containing protein [Marinicella sp. S1101]|uniref:DUF2878 domain-containing protein n=1 Tax=Marinicella marina TaxID=2996016 RepID=UPI002260DD49|nr:DUF2878 domain-containing protein [Marinicella marina]MCX7553927.1 DUF2878 domain-containing protein [Marinicella marina]MDJ1140419.1 DUF2878 domain-containing protein [Marinicella marina]